MIGCANNTVKCRPKENEHTLHSPSTRTQTDISHGPEQMLACCPFSIYFSAHMTRHLMRNQREKLACFTFPNQEFFVHAVCVLCARCVCRARSVCVWVCGVCAVCTVCVCVVCGVSVCEKSTPSPPTVHTLATRPLRTLSTSSSSSLTCVCLCVLVLVCMCACVRVSALVVAWWCWWCVHGGVWRVCTKFPLLSRHACFPRFFCQAHHTKVRGYLRASNLLMLALLALVRAVDQNMDPATCPQRKSASETKASNRSWAPCTVTLEVFTCAE